MPTDPLTVRTRASLLARLQNAADRPAWDAAWDEFFAQYTPMILAWCGRWGLPPADAEEVASAVLFVLGRRMTSFRYDPSRRFRRWLKTVVHNEVKAAFARRAARPGDYGSGGAADDALAAVPDGAGPADELADELDARRDLLGKAMADVRPRVEPHTWAAFERTAVEDHPAPAVAAELGMTVVAVYKAKSRVLDLLRQAVDRRAGGDA